MKKLLISAILLSTMLGAEAVKPLPDQLQSLTPTLVSKDKLPKLVGETPHMLTRAGDIWDFGYCAGMATAVGYPGGYVLEAAIEIPTFMSKNWKGNKIKTVMVGFGQSTNKEILLYITNDLQGVPEYMETVTLDKEMGWNVIDLKTPYEIDGNPFYIGYQTVTPGASTTISYPLGVDLIYSENDYADIMGVGDGEEIEYYNIGTLYGNFAIRFEMEGEVQPEFDALPDTLFVEELVSKNDPFEAQFTMVNLGSETITDVDLTVTVGGVELKNLEISTLNIDGSVGIPFGVLGLVDIKGDFGDVTGIDLPVDITINALKGANGAGEFFYELQEEITVLAESYPRNVVAEEFTGTWCVWCPRGIVGMDYMREKYSKDGFIGIAIHYDDPMETSSYLDMINAYGVNPSTGQLSFPGAVMDRSAYFDPAKETLEEYYANLKKVPSVGKIDLEAQFNEESGVINATSTVEFVADADDASYAVAYVVTEDNVGPYYQQNAFAGGGQGELEGWSDAGARVRTYYEMVARYIDSSFGIIGSVPSQITAKTPYKNSVSISITDIQKSLTQVATPPEIKINDCHVIAMILNTKSGEVVNATQVSLKGEAGIEGIVADPEGGVYKVYNPQGMKLLETQDASDLNNLPRGIYIINGKKVKI